MKHYLASCLGVISLIVLAPVVAFGAAGELTVFENLVNSIGDIVDLLIPIAASLAVVAFFWGLATYIFSDASDKKGKDLMLWGTIALFVIFSVWGIINFIGDIFGIDQVNTMRVPEVVH